jgi:multidrug efflux pump subunit AcrA (membrane-fusion protein)
MKSKKKSRTKKYILIFAVIVALLVIAFIVLQPKGTVNESVEAKTGDISTYYSFSGNVEAKNRQTVMSEKVMQISDLNVEVGDSVKEGDVLFTTTTDDEIKAEIDGEVSEINIEENAQVMAGIALMKIVDYNNLEINVKVDEYDLSALEVGKEATVYIGAIDKEMNGTVDSIAKEGQVVNGVTFFLAAINLEKDENVKVGMSAEVKFLSASVTSAVTLPMSVIQFDANNQPFVYLEADNGKTVATDITTGINDGTTVEVLSGINSGDMVYYSEKSSSSIGFGMGSGNGGA